MEIHYVDLAIFSFSTRQTIAREVISKLHVCHHTIRYDENETMRQGEQKSGSEI